jgi:formate-dependent phosphoribosylglycinamide formyltransferase (GAR transformylase)
MIGDSLEESCSSPQPALLLGTKELGKSMTETANRLGLTQPAVSIAIRRGEEIASHYGYLLFGK